jgi:hypothetical protein
MVVIKNYAQVRCHRSMEEETEEDLAKPAHKPAPPAPTANPTDARTGMPKCSPN